MSLRLEEPSRPRQSHSHAAAAKLVPYRGSRWSGWIHPGLEEPDLLERPHQIREMPAAEIIIERQGRRIYRVRLALGGRRQPCFCYWFDNDSWSRLLRETYAFRVMRQSFKMKRSGFLTLEPLAALKRRGQLLNRESFVVVREIEAVTEIASPWRHFSRVHQRIDLTPEIASSLGEAIARLHSEDFFHGDLKTRHILVADHSGEPRFYFIDLENCRHLTHSPTLLKDALAARDLIQFFSSLRPPKATPSRRMSEARQVLIDTYLKKRPVGDRRRRRLRKFIELYGPGGSFRQGRTLLGNLLHRFR